MQRKISLSMSWLALAAVILTTGPAGAIVPADRTDLAEYAFRRDDLYVRNVLRTVDQMPALERLELHAALTQLGAPANGAFYDARAGAWGTLVLRQALVPGSGAGNDLRWADLGISAPVDEAELRAAVWQALAGFLAVHVADLGIDPAELSPRVTVHEDGRVVQVYAQRVVAGVPVRDSHLSAVVNGGNLVLLGAKNWGSIPVSPVPSLSPESAADAVAVHVAPHQITGRKRPARLEYLPLAVGEPGETATGEGLDFALAWALYPAIPGGAESWEALVDAHTGELLALRDANHYFDRHITGGVLPVSNDGGSPNGIPDGIEQPGFPMPFADVAQPFGTSTVTNSSGLADNIGSVLHTTLNGPFVRMNDLCGTVDEVAVCGDLDLGIGAGTDCQVPAGRSAGDTRASRTGFFEVNRIVEQAKSWLPANSWLGQQLTANMNLDNSCNAFWNGETINFYTSGVSGSYTCRNTGEIAAVFDHEWGHGMDDNDGNGEISRPGEAYADIAALVRLADSCVGRGFFQNNSLGGRCTGFGDPCLECSGVRDADWQGRASGLPHDIAWILQTVETPGVPGVTPGGGCIGADVPLPTLSDGPCGQSTHCEGSVVSEVVWDLLQRDLRCQGSGWENVPGDGSGPVGGGRCGGGAAPTLDFNTTLNAMARILYEGGGAIGEWYSCDATGVAAGCNLDGGYMNFLAVDDDNGDLLDGTPHFEAIHAAFDRHDMACRPFAVGLSDSGCAAPLATPVVTGVAEEAGATISWSPVAGASEYWVFRTDGIHGCEFGKERVAITTGTEHSDAGLLAGRDYFYTVEAVGANGSCRSAASACETVVPDAQTVPEAAIAFREAAEPFEILSGDQDEFLDNCEEAVFRFRVENAGSVDLTNVRISAVSSPSHSGMNVITALPAPLGDLATADCGEHGVADAAFEFIAEGLGFDDTVVFEITIDADQLTSPLVGTISLSGTESDFELTLSRTFSFEDDFERWQTVSGSYTRQSPGANGTLVHLASSAAQSGACDEIQSPEIKLTAGSELSLHSNFVTEPGSTAFYDRANVGLFEVATGQRVTVDPDSGQLYNASGSGSVCVTANQNGWAGVGGGFLPSGWSADALDAAARAGQRLRLDLAYGTDPLVEGLGFQFDEVTLTNFELQVEDTQSDSCPTEPNDSPIAVDDSATTDQDAPVEIAVLANDSDPDGDPITLDSVTQPAHGTAAMNPGGTVSYTPDPGFSGTDVFSYTISDDKGAEATGIVTITVRPEGGGEPCDLCADGKPAELTLTYRGGDCSASDNTQGSKAGCQDFAGPPPADATVYIVASDDDKAPDDSDSDSDREWFRGGVEPEEAFTLEAENGDKDNFGSKLFVHIFDADGGTLLQTVEIHTSCSAPLVEGERFGSVETGAGDDSNECAVSQGASGRVHGSGYLAGLGSGEDDHSDSDSDSDKINFSFDARFRKGGLEGKLKLKDKVAGVEIDAKQIDSLTTGPGHCNGAPTGAGAFELTATGSFESGGVKNEGATFRVCGEDNGKHGKGTDTQPPDRLLIECVVGCGFDYDTASRTPDDGIDGGNIHLHDPIVVAEDGADGGSGGGSGGGAGGGSAAAADDGVLTLDPMLLSTGVTGTPQLLTAELERPLGVDFDQAPITLHWRDALGVTGSLVALTDNFGLALFVTPIQQGDTVYWASLGELDSNRVEIRSID